MENIIQYALEVIFPALYKLAILALLYRIGTAVLDQTEFLKSEDEISNIGNN